MYSEPTISPNFVVRQKRKLTRHPLFIGGVFSLVILGIIGILAIASSVTGASANETATPVRYESRIIFEATEEALADIPTEEPDLIIRAETINISQVQSPAAVPASSQSIEPQAQCNITPTGDVNVNIRSGPDMMFSLISVLNNRNVVNAIAVSDNRWFQILNKDGTIGWVGGSVVDEDGNCEDLPRMSPAVCRVSNSTGNQVNIRAGASISSAIIRTLLAEDVLMADGQTQNGWYRVLLTGQMGWVYRDVVALSDTCSSLAVISADEPAPQPVLADSSLVFSDEDCVIESFTGNPVDLHQTPDMSSQVVAKLNKTMQANRISTNGWYELEGFGWAFAGDLVSRGLCSLLPSISPEEVRSDLLFASAG